ncbi:MAG: potassium channel family protein [Clostridia bacterium]|nr:potassium channel family protein [Clostridia bacterium]
MVNFRLLWSIVKRCHVEKILLLFIACFFFGALIIMGSEPKIHNYGDALWYTFAACTSIGFGDFAAITATGRIVTVFLTLYEIFLVAMLSAVVVSHYMEVIHRREKHTATVFMDKLEHLTELDKEELYEIQERAKQIKI